MNDSTKGETQVRVSEATARPGAAPAKVEDVLREASRPPWRRPALWLGVLVLAAVVGSAWYWQGRQQTAAVPRYVTDTARQGDLRLTVTADGKLQATRTVAIGSELSGTVRAVHVDVNDRVKKGQVLVELDTAKLGAQVERSRAAVAASRARLAQASATVKETQANLARLEEVARLSGGKVPSAAELDAARATLVRARADENSARANVDDARAALTTDETNLSKASIRAPIDGMVLARTVEPGNAVAASLQAVTLLQLAEDLTKLLVEVSVDEADVGAVQVDQPATFTVAAWPQRRYPARVSRVAFGSTLTENVVTYATRLEVDNTDLSLRPGMTATASIVAAERTNALLVPNTALRFTPAAAPGNAGAGSGASAGSSGGILSKLMPRPSRERGRAPGAGAVADSPRVWVLENGAPRRVPVTTGITDGRLTEITGGELKPGMAVIVDQLAGSAAR